jgi:hypothetical protein
MLPIFCGIQEEGNAANLNWQDVAAKPQGFMPLQAAFGFNTSAFLFDDLRKTCTLDSGK